MRVNSDDIELTDEGAYLFNGRPFTGIGFDLDADGRIWSELEFVDGRQTGVTKGYERGRLIRETQFLNGVYHGVHRQFDDDGCVEAEEVYEHGICLCRFRRNIDGELELAFELLPADPNYKTLELMRKAFA